MPMRVIAKKRCRAMFEPPEKGGRATLNPNLSTRLKPTFFRSGTWAAGWLLLVEEGERAALNFQPKDFEIVQQDQVRDPSPTNRAVSIRCRMFSLMSELGQSRRFNDVPVTSALPLIADLHGKDRHFRKKCQDRTWALLFNCFVGAREHCGRNFEAERLGGLEIDDQLEPGRLFDRQVGRFGARARV